MAKLGATENIGCNQRKGERHLNTRTHRAASSTTPWPSPSDGKAHPKHAQAAPRCESSLHQGPTTPPSHTHLHAKDKGTSHPDANLPQLTGCGGSAREQEQEVATRYFYKIGRAGRADTAKKHREMLYLD